MAVKVGLVAIAGFRFLFVSLLVFVLLCGATWAIAYLIAWSQDGVWFERHYLSIALLCTLAAAAIFTFFHLRRDTRHMPFAQRDQFIAKAKTVLHEMGYALISARGDTLTFRPRFHSYLFGGAIQITLENQEARLTGPRVSLDIFRRCLRLMNHVQRVQLYLKDQRKVTENVVKRIDLTLRLRPDQFEEINEHVIEVFERDGNVNCELNLSVSSENGIRAFTLDNQIIDWLEKEGIYFEIQKDHVHLIEIEHPELEPASSSH